MSTDGDAILRYAQADRELDEKARPVLTQIIKEIEDRSGIKIAEFRVTIDPSHSGNGWPSVNCVIMRERQRARINAICRRQRSPRLRHFNRVFQQRTRSGHRPDRSFATMR